MAISDTEFSFNHLPAKKNHTTTVIKGISKQAREKSGYAEIKRDFCK